MCLNKLSIKNKYTGMSILVNCGKCDACKQERRNFQAQLFRNNSSGYVLFVTLTYSDVFCPVISLSSYDFHTENVPVYRGVFKSKLLGSFNNIFYEDNDLIDGCHTIGVNYDCIGVLWQKDISNFFKRLRKRLQISYHLTISSYFYVREYGSNFQRPHFHICFFAPQEVHELYKSAIIESWPFCCWSKLPLDESFKTVPSQTTCNYVASYVNKLGCLPKILQNKEISIKTWHSNFFGFQLPQFEFVSFFRAAEQHTCTYISQKVCVNDSCVSLFLYPKYVASRYFPKVKGFSRLAYDDFLYVYKYGFNSYYRKCLDYNDDDVKRSNVLISRCRSLASSIDVDYDYYLFVFFNYYVTYACTLIKLMHQNLDGIPFPPEHLQTCYYNFAEYFRNSPKRLSLLSFDYNFAPDNVLKHSRLDTQYQETLYKYNIKSLLPKKIHG